MSSVPCKYCKQPAYHRCEFCATAYCCEDCQRFDWIEGGHSLTSCGTKLIESGEAAREAAREAALHAALQIEANGTSANDADEIENTLRRTYPGFANALDLWWSKQNQPGSWKRILAKQKVLFAVPQQAKRADAWHIRDLRKSGSSGPGRTYTAPASNVEMLMPLLMIKVPETWSGQAKGSSTTREAYSGQKVTIAGAGGDSVDLTWGAPYFVNIDETKKGARPYRLEGGEWILDPSESYKAEVVRGRLIVSNKAGAVVELGSNPLFASRGDLINAPML